MHKKYFSLEHRLADVDVYEFEALQDRWIRAIE